MAAQATNEHLSVLGVENTTSAGTEQQVVDLVDGVNRSRRASCDVRVEFPQRKREIVDSKFVATYVERVLPSKPPVVAREPPIERTWNLRTSVWKRRPREADSKSFYDAQSFLKHVATADVAQTKIGPLLAKSHKRDYDEVFEATVRVLQKYEPGPASFLSFKRVLSSSFQLQKRGVVDRSPVSYTHLTLPTIYSV